MLSRFSTLLVYVVAGLALSAAATPMGHPRGYDDGSKSPSYPGSSYSSSTPSKYPEAKKYPEEKKYPEQKPYPKSYAEEKKYPEEKRPMEKYSEEKEKKYPEEKKYEEKRPMEKYRPKQRYSVGKYDDEDKRKSDDDKRKPYDDDKRKSYDDEERKSDEDKRKSYDDDDERKPYDDDKRKSDDNRRKPYDDGEKRKPYDDHKNESHGQCSVENQHCCNQVNKASHIHSSSVILSLTCLFRRIHRLPSTLLAKQAYWGTSSSLTRLRTPIFSWASIALPYGPLIPNATIMRCAARTTTRMACLPLAAIISLSNFSLLALIGCSGS